MKKRFILAAICILALPPLFSPSQAEKQMQPVSFATVALAGRTAYGDYCECGTPGCLCAPTSNPDKGGDASAKNNDQAGLTGTNATSGVMALALAIFLWFRMRL